MAANSRVMAMIRTVIPDNPDGFREYAAMRCSVYTPTLRKSGKTSFQPALRRFCFIHDPPWLPGQRIALRPD